jgi:hypothetical protein
VEFDAGRLSLTGSAYDVAPWGPQTVISRVFRCSNGLNAGIDFKPLSRLDLEFDYSRSVPLQLNSFSFGIGVDLTWLLRPNTRRH